MNSKTIAIQYKYNVLNDLGVFCGCGMADVLGTLSAFLRGQNGGICTLFTWGLRWDHKEGLTG